MNSSTDPNKMTAAEGLEELAEILAAAILRLHARQATQRRISRDSQKDSLGNPAETRPPVTAGKA